MPLSLQLALKYLRPRRTFLSAVNSLCVLGILIGAATLIVVISVMSGFDDMWKKKILGFSPHVVVTTYQEAMPDRGELYDRVRAVPGVLNAVPFVQSLVVVEHKNRVHAPFLRGVDPATDDMLKDPRVLQSGRLTMDEGQVLIGTDLAATLGAGPGAELTLFAPAGYAQSDELRLPDEFTVSGIFEFGMYQIDEGFVLTSLENARDLLGMDSGAHGMQVTVADPLRAFDYKEAIEAAVGPSFSVRTWMELNETLFGALAVEKRLMFFLLAIISVVASFMVMSTLITITVQKTREIGLLKAIGFSSQRVMAIFLWYGLIQGVLGLTLGTGGGLLLLHYRNDVLNWTSETFGWQLFPKELYFLSELPAVVNPGEILFINAVLLAFCLVASLVPSWLAAQKDPVRSLRYE